MITWNVEAIPNWPYQDTGDRSSAGVFKAGWDDTLKMLDYETDRLGREGIVTVCLVCDAKDVRRDGMLRSQAFVGHPGAIVQFTDQAGDRLQFASDAKAGGWMGCTHKPWQANVRNIALALEALRAVDRYGVTRTGEQYRGFKALPSGHAMAPVPPGNGARWRTGEDAVEWMRAEAFRESPGPITTAQLEQESPGKVWRFLAQRWKPEGGSSQRWDDLNLAREMAQKAGLL